jgi:hypothetical protein
VKIWKNANKEISVRFSWNHDYKYFWGFDDWGLISMAGVCLPSRAFGFGWFSFVIDIDWS